MADNSGIVSTGANAINIQYLAPSALVRTQYHRQVERIAPPNLADRAAELDELAAFCTSSATYAWWRARAWSGKSALMSWFVLHPPAGVRIVSFFITARLAAQNDRNAFVENVLEQLLALLGESMPAFLTESTREAHLLDLVDRAARTCHERGEHFVLLVDGLDEDRGVDEHSIAALLPLSPPPGMHVLVAGRPNPPVPADVPSHHPLRDPSIIRELTPSPRAQALRVEMEKDLKRLLQNPDSRDLLGLVTAAGGGLSAADLVSLTGQLLWEINDQLQTVAGRSFAIRDPYYSTEAPAAYLLAHEELQVTALEMLGPARLTAYRDRLHSWAHGYRDRQWPADTPEYLLRGYFRLLIATDNIPELLTCATDVHRQDRLLNLTGGDTAALAELGTAMEALAAKENPDLVALTRLAIHRRHLAHRHAEVPVELAEAWAALGNFDRAQAVADSMTKLGDRVTALVLVAEGLHRRYRRDRAKELLDHAERVARTATDYEEQAEALTAVAAALVRTGDPDRAEALVSEVPWLTERMEAKATVAVELAAAGAVDRAEALLDDVHLAKHAVDVLIALAPARGAGVVARIRELMDDQENWIGQHRLAALPRLVAAVSEDQVDGLLEWARELAEHDDDPRTRRILAEALAAAGRLSEAEAVARAIGFPLARASALVAVARANSARAAELLDMAERAIRSESAGIPADDELAALAEGFARIGDADRAMSVAVAVLEPEKCTRALARVATKLAERREPERAATVLARAEQTAHVTRTDADNYLNALAQLTEALAIAGEHGSEAIDRVAAIFEAAGPADAAWRLGIAMVLSGHFDRGLSLADPPPVDRFSAGALAAVAARVAEAGRVDLAIEVLDRATRAAEHPATSFTGLNDLVRTLVAVGALASAERVALAAPAGDIRAELLATLAVAAADSGSGDQAVQIVERITESADNVTMRVALAGVLARAGQLDRARSLLPKQLTAVTRWDALRAVAKAFAHAGDVDLAWKAVESIADVDYRPMAAAQVAGAVADAGRFDEALEIGLAITDVAEQPRALTAVATAVAAAGDHRRAEQIARLIGDPASRGEALLRVRSTDHRLVAEALTLTHWFLAAPAVVASAPGSLAAIFDELDRAYGRSLRR